MLNAFRTWPNGLIFSKESWSYVNPLAWWINPDHNKFLIIFVFRDDQHDILAHSSLPIFVSPVHFLIGCVYTNILLSSRSVTGWHDLHSTRMHCVSIVFWQIWQSNIPSQNLTTTKKILLHMTNWYKWECLLFVVAILYCSSFPWCRLLFIVAI